MSISIECTKKEVDILTENNIDFDIYNIEDILLGNADIAEIEFENNEELEKAIILLGR